LFAARRQRLRYEENVPDTGDTLFALLRRLYVENETEATDPRDRIYGVLGLAVDKQVLGIMPDYKDHDYCGLLTRAARAMVKTNGLDVLSYSRFPKELCGLPTWVPEWQSNMQQSYYPPRSRADPHLFNASKDTKMALKVTTNTSILSLEGIVADFVEDVGETWHKPATIQGNHGLYLTFFSRVRLMCVASAAKNHPIYPSQARRREAEWRVPIADLYTYAGTTTRPKPEVRRQFEAFVALCELFNLGEDPALSGADMEHRHAAVADPDMSHYLTSLETTSGLRPFLTSKGYVGVGPVAMEHGDIVVMLLGARIPYVLRARDEVGWSLVGEAYCDGVMDGELATNVPIKTFDIS
jgi:hypothetical protein